MFKTLRILAFICAGFILAKYGWKAISSGKLAGSDNVVDGLKKIGIPMIIGFTLLFSIGILLGYLSNGDNFGCPALTKQKIVFVIMVIAILACGYMIAL